MKINSVIIKIILLLIILTFFLPFFIVSCGNQEISFTGFEIAFGKRGGNYTFQEGNPLILILVAAPIVLLVLSLFMRKINIKEIVYIIVSGFNTCAAVTVRIAAQIMLEREIAEHSFISGSFGLTSLIKLRSGAGFAAYIFLNIAILVILFVNYLMMRNNKFNKL